MNRWHPICFESIIKGEKTRWDLPDDHEKRLQTARLALLPKRLKSSVNGALSWLAMPTGSWAPSEVDAKRIAAEFLDEAAAIAQELKRLASEPKKEEE